MADWTRNQVEERLEEAAAVMKRLPPVRVQGYFSAWPEVMHSFGDLVGQEPRLKLPPPSARAIDRMDETMLWLRWLDSELAKLVWARAEARRGSRSAGVSALPARPPTAAGSTGSAYSSGD